MGEVMAVRMRKVTRICGSASSGRVFCIAENDPSGKGKQA